MPIITHEHKNKYKLQVARITTYTQNHEIGLWVKVDFSSGGYPNFETNIFSADVFQSLEAAQQYNKTFNNAFDIYPIESMTMILGDKIK